MTVRVTVSEAARADRRSITAFTIDRFGLVQARRLTIRFQDAVTALADNPSLGSPRPEFDPPGYDFRYFVVMRVFMIVYRQTSEGLEIARILHTSRNLAVELERDAGSGETG